MQGRREAIKVKRRADNHGEAQDGAAFMLLAERDSETVVGYAPIRDRTR
jgi:hypothetical protein